MTWSFVTLLAIYFFSACEKGNERDTFIPFLTDRLWQGDTITINPPVTYEQLSVEDQQSIQTATSWFRNARITLNENGTVKGAGDDDPGYTKWRLVNNDADIEMTRADGSTLLLRSWLADPFTFSYTSSLAAANKSFDCTFVYK